MALVPSDMIRPRYLTDCCKAEVFFSLMHYNCSLPESFKKSFEACEQASSVSAQSRISLTYCSTTALERLQFCRSHDKLKPLQCSCLESPRDGGAWWTSVYGVTQNWTRLKRLSSSSSSMTNFAQIDGGCQIPGAKLSRLTEKLAE